MRLIKENVERIAESEVVIAKLKADGFRELETTQQEAVTDETEKGYEDMSLEELKVVAKGKAVGGYSSLRKEELIAVLKGMV